MSMILLMTGALCVLASIILFILYLTMGKAAGRRLMRELKDEY